MKYIGMPAGMWYLFKKSFRDHLVSVMNYDERTADDITAQAKWKYRSIIDKLPEFEKEDRFLMNAVNCAMLAAFILSMPERPTVEMLTDYYAESMMIEPMKLFCRLQGRNKFSAEDIKEMRETVKLKAADRNPYSWNMDFHIYKDGSGYEARFTKCGICTLMKELGLYDLVPAMCNLDYVMSEAGGAADFVREHTLASGGPYCDCGYKRKSHKYMKKKIIRIRTGGQSGVDRAAMDFAKEHDIPLCGWCPKNGWAEDYPEPPGLLKDYPELTETPSESTEQRTKWNMRDCDAILTIIPEGSGNSPGTETGLQEGESLGKPMYTAKGIADVPDIIRWIGTLPDETELCIGGPRASECPDAYEIAKSVLVLLHEAISGAEKKHYIYILRCADGTYYTGYTTDPERRTKVHNSGKGAKYTRPRRPVELVYTEEYWDKSEAQKREYAIKQLTRAEKEKLING